jgi:hypothetical protein
MVLIRHLLPYGTDQRGGCELYTVIPAEAGMTYTEKKI